MTYPQIIAQLVAVETLRRALDEKEESLKERLTRAERDEYERYKELEGKFGSLAKAEKELQERYDDRIRYDGVHRRLYDDYLIPLTYNPEAYHREYTRYHEMLKDGTLWK